MTNIGALERVPVRVARIGTILEPNSEAEEKDGIINPGCARDRNGEVLLYPRLVAKDNVSRIGIVRKRERDGNCEFERIGTALEPQTPYEMRKQAGGYGCEDARVTFVAQLDLYLMAYTAYGEAGPRIALAVSEDGVRWERMGPLQFSKPGMHIGDDKDAAFFPEPIRSPEGVMSLAFFHRPMLHLSALDGHAAIPRILALPLADRESIRVGYIPLDPVLADRANLLTVRESEMVLCPNEDWGSLKVGCGTPPVRVPEGWLSIFHGVDVLDPNPVQPLLKYSAGLLIQDYDEPHRVLYRSPKPIFQPKTRDERKGMVDNVIFPSGLDVRTDLGDRIFDCYYGQADFTIGLARLEIGASTPAREPAETAA